MSVIRDDVRTRSVPAAVSRWCAASSSRPGTPVTTDDPASMGTGGALADPDVLAGLRRLAEVVRAAAAMPERTEPPKMLNRRRPGWVGSMVMEVLKTATEPMTPIEITREIERQFGQQAVHASVTYVLRSGRQTRANLIERVAPGRYALRDKP